MAESLEWIGEAEGNVVPRADVAQAAQVAEAAKADPAVNVAAPERPPAVLAEPSHPVPAPVMEAASARAEVMPQARGMPGERSIARILRVGSALSGLMFLASLGLEALPVNQTTSVAIDHLQKGAASLLLVTPVARLAAAGLLLGRRGEWRYAVYTACVLGMLALAVGAGIAA